MRRLSHEQTVQKLITGIQPAQIEKEHSCEASTRDDRSF
jgi:hypothetical protein